MFSKSLKKRFKTIKTQRWRGVLCEKRFVKRLYEHNN